MNSFVQFAPRRKRISITALIDVVFILLMFFMLTSTFDRWQQMQLSGAAQGQSKSDEPAFLLLDEGNQVRWLAVQQNLANSIDQNQIDASWLSQYQYEQGIVVMMSPEAQLQNVLSLIEQLKKLGVEQVVLGDTLDSKRNLPRSGI